MSECARTSLLKCILGNLTQMGVISPTHFTSVSHSNVTVTRHHLLRDHSCSVTWLSGRANTELQLPNVLFLPGAGLGSLLWRWQQGCLLSAERVWCLVHQSRSSGWVTDIRLEIKVFSQFGTCWKGTFSVRQIPAGFTVKSLFIYCPFLLQLRAHQVGCC